MERENFKNLFTAVASVAALCIILKSIGQIVLLSFLPFAAAWVISIPVKPLSALISKKFKLKQSFCAAILIILIIALLCFLIISISGTLIREAGELINDIMSRLSEEDNLLNITFEKINKFREKLPNTTSDAIATDTVYDGLISLILSSLQSVSDAVAKTATSLISGLPDLIFALITTVIALFYISADSNLLYDKKSLSEAPALIKSILLFKENAANAVKKYAKSYLIILLITFSELFLGFVLLRIDYALLLSLITAIIDFLPVLGTGIVLVPWSIACFISGNIKRGVGLLVLWGIMYVVRQLTEPKIVSGVMGIHPLLSLFSIYLGYISCGFIGMIIFPILLYIAKESFKKEKSVEPTQ